MRSSEGKFVRGAEYTSTHGRTCRMDINQNAEREAGAREGVADCQ